MSFLCSAIYYIALLLTVAKRRVCAPVAHKIEYVPMHTIREITRLATMLARLIASRLCLGFVSALPQLRLGFASATSRLYIGYTSTTPHLRLHYALASIACEHCRSSRNNPHCATRHVIYYLILPKRAFVQCWRGCMFAGKWVYKNSKLVSTWK